MANRSDADEDDHLDLTLAIHHLGDYFAAERAIETLLNCGTSRHARTVAQDAGITIITDATGTVIDARLSG